MNNIAIMVMSLLLLFIEAIRATPEILHCITKDEDGFIIRVPSQPLKDQHEDVMGVPFDAMIPFEVFCENTLYVEPLDYFLSRYMHIETITDYHRLSANLAYWSSFNGFVVAERWHNIVLGDDYKKAFFAFQNTDNMVVMTALSLPFTEDGFSFFHHFQQEFSIGVVTENGFEMIWSDVYDGNSSPSSSLERHYDDKGTFFGHTWPELISTYRDIRCHNILNQNDCLYFKFLSQLSLTESQKTYLMSEDGKDFFGRCNYYFYTYCCQKFGLPT